MTKEDIIEMIHEAAQELGMKTPCPECTEAIYEELLTILPDVVRVLIDERNK